MNKILILTDEFCNTISPVSFLNGYLHESGKKADEFVIDERTDFNELFALAGSYEIIGLSSWGHDRKEILDLLFNLRKNGKTTVIGGPGIIEEQKHFTHTVSGPGEYFLLDLLNGKKLPPFYRETKEPPYKFKLTDFLLAKLPEMDNNISVGVRTFDGCYWGKCYFCTYNQNYPNRLTLLDENKASLISSTFDKIVKNIKEVKSHAEVTFYMSHASINEKNLDYLLEAIKKSEKNFKWVTFIRPEPWVIKYLKDIRNLNGILDIGYEFICNRDLINKGCIPEHEIRVSLEAFKEQVPVKGNFLYCIPEAEEKDLIECAVNIGRIRHCFSSFVLGQLFIEKETEFYRKKEDFHIICHDDIIDYGRSGVGNYMPHFEDYSGFRTVKDYNIFIEHNKKFAMAVAEIMETEISSWEDPIDLEVVLPPLDKQKVYNILIEYFDDKDFIKKSIDNSWRISSGQKK
ncbi:MAG: hypothetical protein ABRQ37_00540 [Candidatus Eremiobacterota bacterium]